MIQVKVTETTSGNFFIQECETLKRAKEYAAFVNSQSTRLDCHLKTEIIKK